LRAGEVGLSLGLCCPPAADTMWGVVRAGRRAYHTPESAAVSLPLPPLRGIDSIVLPTTSRRAIDGLVLGLLSFLLGILASIPAFYFAARALGEINRDPARVKGRGLALTGIFAA